MPHQPIYNLLDFAHSVVQSIVEFVPKCILMYFSVHLLLMSRKDGG